MTTTTQLVSDFIHETDFGDLPQGVRHQARRCFLDLVGVAAAGRATPLSRIVRSHAAINTALPSARLFFDGRSTGVAQAAMANAATIDSLDGHDGHRLTKGHAGVAVLPAVMAFATPAPDQSTDELLTALVVGYEVALRAGITLHRIAGDYHSSGAWNALGVAAVGARALRLDSAATAEALGIAEYTAPRGPMMRAIAHPTMVKDSSAWGAQAGAVAAQLAAAGFTGAPADLLGDGDESQDLGERWLITEQYFKPHPVCRWAQPAVEAILSLTRETGIDAAHVEAIDVMTFDPATRLATIQPTTTEEAQYSLPFAVAAAAVHGSLEPAVLLEPLSHPDVIRVCERVRLVERGDLTALFPAQRWAQVSLRSRDGTPTTSELTEARGDPEHPLTDGELLAKFRRYTGQVDEVRARSIARVVMDAEEHDAGELQNLLCDPLDRARP